MKNGALTNLKINKIVYLLNTILFNKLYSCFLNGDDGEQHGVQSGDGET